MITLFTIPKAFTDPHIRVIQKNAIGSWLELVKLDKNIEIILLGDDAGVSEMARELQIKHIPRVKTTEFGTPFLDSAFELVSREAKNDILMYSNADIVYTENLIDSIKKIAHLKKFLGVGRRIDLDVTDEINFNDQNESQSWKKILDEKIQKEGTLHSSAGMDYFIFRKNSLEDASHKIPPLIVGRVGWDNWMIWNAKKMSVPVIDMTKSIIAVHQNHQYSGINSLEKRKTNPEALANLKYLGSTINVYTTDDATMRLENGALKRNFLHWLPLIKRQVSALLSFSK